VLKEEPTYCFYSEAGRVRSEVNTDHTASTADTAVQKSIRVLGNWLCLIYLYQKSHKRRC